jgi:FkbM family methyltransferase
MTKGLIRQLIKRILPNSIVQVARRLRRSACRNHPGLAFLRDNSAGVLRCRIAYNKYGGYCVPLSSQHRPAAQTILAGRVWESSTIDFLTSHGGNGDIVHAGTYFGDFLPALSHSCGIGAKVWAFEPNPENYRCALVTVTINGIQNVELQNAGVGARRGSLPMVVLDNCGRSLGGISRIVERSDEGNKKGLVNVDIVTIDEIVPPDRTVSIIQLDVEGFEKEALTGALTTVRRCKPILVLEWLPEESWFSKNIIALGYRIGGVVGEKSHKNTILSAV